MCQQILRKAKADYYNNNFEKYEPNIKEICRVLKEAIGLVKKCNLKFPDYFMEEVATDVSKQTPGGGTGDGDNHRTPPPPPEPPPESVITKVSDKKAIAEGFNKYYTSIGSKLSSLIKGQNCVPGFDFKTHVKLAKGTFSFQEVDTDLILKIVNSLQTKNSSGTDGISNVMLKTISPFISKPLNTIFNRSLKNGTVPEGLKSAKVIPLYKGKDSGSPFEYTNYRPISLLQSMSKVLEKLVDKQGRNYLKYKDVLYSKQFGFRGRRGCDQALLLFTDFTKN